MENYQPKPPYTFPSGVKVVDEGYPDGRRRVTLHTPEDMELTEFQEMLYIKHALEVWGESI